MRGIQWPAMAKGDRANLERLLRRAWEDQCRIQMGKIPPKVKEPDKSAKIFFYVGIGLTFVIWGTQLAGVTVNVYLAAIVLLLAFACIVYAFWIWEGASRWHWLLRLGTVCLTSIIYFSLAGKQVVSEWKKEHVPPPLLLPQAKWIEPKITMVYSPRWLPIKLAPEESVYLFTFDQDKTIKSRVLKNDFGSNMVWPTDKKIIPPDSVGLVTLSTDRTVFNLKVVFDFNNGSQSSHEVEIPALRVNKPYSVFFVNRSNNGLFLMFRDSVTLDVENDDQRHAAVVPLQGGMMSKIIPQLETLFPSYHKWDGDRMLNPDMRAEARPRPAPSR